jgi:hypothetical protein
VTTSASRPTPLPPPTWLVYLLWNVDRSETCCKLGKATGALGPNLGVFLRLVAFLRPQNVIYGIKMRHKVSK